MAASLSLSGAQSIVPADNVNVSGDPTSHQSEMTLDVNPFNPLNLAGFSHHATQTGFDFPMIDVFYTLDGGSSWETNTIDASDDGIQTTVSRYDPSIAFDANGNLYISYIHRPVNPFTQNEFTLTVARSVNGGATFSFATSATEFFIDKPHLATGLDPISGNQAVYVAYWITEPAQPTSGILKITGSNDGLQTFRTSQPINDEFNSSDAPHFPDPAVGSSGELYVSWHDRNESKVLMDVDTDGLFDSGDFDDFATDRPVTTFDREFQGVPGASVPAQPQRGIHNGPVLDVDRTGGPNDGRLYLTWVDADIDTFSYSNPNSDVYLAYSDNDGITWSSPTVVEGSSGTDFLPWVDIDQTSGSVNVIYYTSDGDQSSGNDDVHVRLATSVNGGLTFSKANVSDQTSNELDPLGFANDYLEYIGLAVHDGTAHALWSSRVTGGGTDLEALFTSASVRSVTGGNVLTITGDDGQTVTNDIIEVILATDDPVVANRNPNYLRVKVNGDTQFLGLLASVNRIEIDGFGGNDDFFIDADVDADFLIRGGLGVDDVTLRGKGASSLGKFEFFGDADIDTLTVNFVGGDPLPRPGFNFNFIGGDGQDDARVVEVGGGAPLTAYFVNTFADSADIAVGNGRADSSALADDQTTLRAAVQEANFASTKKYIFLPSGTNFLSVAGTGLDTQGDLDITKNVTIIGSGAGVSVIDASGLATDDRIFDVVNLGVLNLQRVTLTLGAAANPTTERNGGAIRVQNGGELNVDFSAIVGNITGRSGDGGAIYFASTGKGKILNSVLTVNEADDNTGGVYLQSASVPDPTKTVTVTNSIIAKNTEGSGSPPDVFAGTNRTFTSGGNNRLGNATTGFTHGVMGDHIGTPNYIVTSVVDTYDGNSDPVFMSLRDAIHRANITTGAEEIWLPAWKFVLTRRRTTPSNQPEMDIAQGDLDISETLTIRGVGGFTSVAWRVSAVPDLTFELLGDYYRDATAVSGGGFQYSVTSLDWALWRDTQGSTTDLRADGNDDGVVDDLDEAIWAAHSNDDTLTLFGV